MIVIYVGLQFYINKWNNSICNDIGLNFLIFKIAAIKPLYIILISHY